MQKKVSVVVPVYYNEGSLPILHQAFEAVRTFKPLGDEERRALLKKTAKLAGTGKFELYKITQFFDGTAEHPEWLG